MELLLALAVITAVIIFGGLISLGNERQRRAIDELREQVVLWAIQDLRIKREHLARDVRVDNPLRWLNKIAVKACGHNLSLHINESSDNPLVITCANEDGSGKFVFTLLSPAEIHAMKRTKHNLMTRYSEHNPLLSLPRDVTVYECSALTYGILFDLELSLAWKGLTGHDIDESGFMWIYIVS